MKSSAVSSFRFFPVCHCLNKGKYLELCREGLNEAGLHIQRDNVLVDGPVGESTEEDKVKDTR